MSIEKVAVAQIPSLRGDIASNIAVHARTVAVAGKQGVSLIVFPELSLTGYELDLADELAISAGDARLRPLAEMARRYQVNAVVGAPLKSRRGKPYLGAIVLFATGATATYAKMHLGGDEPQVFQSGVQPLVLPLGRHSVGLAICADTSVSSHPETCVSLGADIYAAGVFLTPEWYASDVPRLQVYAQKYAVLVLMANQGKSVGTLESIGNSAIWGPDGRLLAQVRGLESALVVAGSDRNEWRAECIQLEGCDQ